jgi:hypothetical protein
MTDDAAASPDRRRRSPRSLAEWKRLIRQRLSDPGRSAAEHLHAHNRNQARARLFDAVLLQNIRFAAKSAERWSKIDPHRRPWSAFQGVE